MTSKNDKIILVILIIVAIVFVATLIPKYFCAKNNSTHSHTTLDNDFIRFDGISHSKDTVIMTFTAIGTTKDEVDGEFIEEFLKQAYIKQKDSLNTESILLYKEQPIIFLINDMNGKTINRTTITPDMYN